MGIVGELLSVGGQYNAMQDQKEANRNAAEEGRKIQGEQKAINAQKQAEERRKMVREERVRAARLEQVSANTGTTGSSGEAGALSGMGTQLGANIGVNLGLAAAGERISGYAQNAADFQLASQQAAMKAQEWRMFGETSQKVTSSAKSLFGG
jgi:hypothetical protein